MKRMMLFATLIVILGANLAYAGSFEKGVAVNFGLFSPADWRIQDNYYPGYNHKYIGVGNGREINGAVALFYDRWRFRLESGSKWQTNSYYEQDYWTNRLMDESKLNIVPIKFDISRRFAIGLWNSTTYLGAGTGVNIAKFKYKHANIIAEGLTGYYTEKYNAVAPEIFMLAGFDIPLSRRFFLQTEIRYSYCSSDWNMYYNGFTTRRVENVNIGGTTFRIGLERRF